MANWHVDEGLARLSSEWKNRHPGATVYFIGDQSHSQRDSDHNPEKSGSKPGQDSGEVDAADFMPGKGVTAADLQDLFDGLIRSRDKRILYVIYGTTIVSSVVRPWERRHYTGAKHSHVHVSVNDNYDNDQSDWKWEKLVARKIEYAQIDGAKLPLLQLGDEDDAQDGWNHVGRAQVLANWLEKKSPLDIDGVYGPASAAKFGRLFGGNGKKLSLDHIKKLHGIS